MKDETQVVSAGPVSESARITSMDLIRGVAVLGILLMNAVHVKLGLVPYDNLSAGGSETWLDWSVGIFGEIFVDQKFMGLFSMLFGAGLLMFIERAAARGARAVLLNLWRNTLLLVIGILHVLVWMGDVLMVYAFSSLFLIAFRKLPGKALIGIGGVVFLLVIAIDFQLQAIANDTGDPLTGIWTQPGATPDSLLGLGILFNFFLRGLAMILIGAGLYRAGFMQGKKSAITYRLTAIIGLVSGLTLAALGVIFVVINDFSIEVAIIGNMPNNLGTIPASLGYMSLIVLWNGGSDSRLKRRLRAAGRMALTNYLTQTILGVLVLTVLLAEVAVNRSGILLFVLAVWTVQLWWSQAWLDHFRFGPAEWLWRVGTYRRLQPLRRAPAT